MKLIILLTLAACLETSARGYSQIISLSLDNAPIEQVFKEIKKQTGFRFVYTKIDIQTAGRVTLNVTDQPLTDVLQAIFEGQPLQYTFDGKYIIIRKKAAVAGPPVLIGISGKVVNENGEPVNGASITVKGTNNGTASAANGEFSLVDLRPSDILIVSSVGYISKEVRIGREKYLVITLSVAVNSLDETVFIAYGKTTRRFNTGSVSKISKEEISRQPVANPLSTLQGRAAGVFIQTQNGLPGGDINVQIRGQGSIAAGNAPLYVIDGVPYLSSPFSSAPAANGANGFISPFSIINPSDIQSIEILKDAEATAIYGSRAANGVILITTKKGSSGKTTGSINYYAGIGKVSHYADYLTLPDYLQIRREAFSNAGVTPTLSKAPDLLVWDTTKSTDWQKYIFGGTAGVSNFQADITGGNANTNFLVSFSSRKETTVLPGDNKYSRNGFHLGIDHISTDKKFKLAFKVLYGRDHNRIIYDASAANFASLAPDFPLYNSDGTLNWSTNSNPAALLLRKSESKINNIIINGNLQYKLLPSIAAKVSFGFTRTDLKQQSLLPGTAVNPAFGSLSSAIFASDFNESIIAEPQIDFSKKTGKGVFSALIGATYQQSLSEGESIEGTNYSNEQLLGNIGAAGTVSGQSNFYTQYKYISGFGRAQYRWNDTYVGSINFRRDGSTRFGPGKEFGNFGAISAAWIFSNSHFIKNRIPSVSYGKIRISYGLTGNDQIPDYGYLSSYGNGSTYEDASTIRPLRLSNKDYSWETNHEFELAIELGLWKERLNIISSFYNNKRSNQLVPYPIPSQTGFTQYQANLNALVRNQGLEFEINSRNFVKNGFSWSTSLNLTIPSNKLLKYPNLEQSSFANTYVIGQDLSVVKRYHFLRVDPQSGIAIFEDVNKDNEISFPSDYVVVGKTSPDFFGGILNDFLMGKFKFSFLIQFVKQHSLGSFPYPGSTIGNSFEKATDRWQGPGDITLIPVPVVSSNTLAYAAKRLISSSDFSLFNTSYLRLKTLFVSYSLDKGLLEKLAMQECDLYAEAQNLFTLTGRNFIDPETLDGANPTMPPVRQIVIGIRFTF